MSIHRWLSFAMILGCIVLSVGCATPFRGRFFASRSAPSSTSKPAVLPSNLEQSVTQLPSTQVGWDKGIRTVSFEDRQLLRNSSSSFLSGNSGGCAFG